MFFHSNNIPGGDSAAVVWDDRALPVQQAAHGSQGATHVHVTECICSIFGSSLSLHMMETSSSSYLQLSA